MENSAPLLNTDEEEAKKEGEWIGERVKSIVYGGLDAILTSFSLISSISASHGSSGSVLVLGFANLVADAIAMGFGDYVSSGAEQDLVEKERNDMEKAVRRHMRPQLSQLLEVYQAQGMSFEDANTVVSVFAKYKNILLDEKMAIEKGMISTRKMEPPWKTGVVTFLSFLTFGIAPLLSFIVLIPFTKNYTIKFICACVLAILALALLGAATARISSQNYGRAIMVTLLNGCLAASAAYVVSWGLKNVTGLED